MELQDYEKEHIAKLREYAAECTLFLKKNEDFPLSAPCKIALFGNGAEYTVKGGTGSGNVNSRFFTTAKDGLVSAGFTIATESWLKSYAAEREAAHAAFQAKLKQAIEEGGIDTLIASIGAVAPEPEYAFSLDSEVDTAVYVLTRNSGEGSDRTYVPGDLLLTETEIRDITEAACRYPRFLLVLNTGGMVDLSPVLDCVSNILLLSQLGVVTGDILADILLGKANPSGKLTMTWATEHDYPTDGHFGAHRTNRYTEGIYVGYRYFATADKPVLFPFGFGLSYTTFSREDFDTTVDGTVVTVHVTVKNTGAFAGKEVLQLYLVKPEGIWDTPAQELAAYRKTALLAPNESERLTLRFDLRDMASYDPVRGNYELNAGDYGVCVGNSSASAVPVCVLRLKTNAVVKHTAHVGGTADFADLWLPHKAQDLSGLPVHLIDADAIKPEEVSYVRMDETDPYLASFTDEELALICVGAYDRRLFASNVGNSAFSVIGAAGETVLSMPDKITHSIAMADGPAGLRLEQQYGEDENGAYALPNPFIEYLLKNVVPESIAKSLGYTGEKKPERHGVIKTQYCTAIPIGTAIAQSFNDDFAAMCGDLVGDEMERYGVHLWLAPALNIHRDPRCGRNFEYFSEDPLLSGKMAAALTRGVQAHPGCGTTIKHFCCNNQETNRMRNDSMVSERALREIYTKGFGICVRESHPKALMTSYNLLNGTHTAERRDLVTDLLRSEFGFDGIVMTDWIGSENGSPEGEYRVGSAPETIAAGNDLCMPGAQRDVDFILEALKDGRLKRADLLVSATRIYRMIEELHELHR